MNNSLNKYIANAKNELNAKSLLEENVTRDILDKSDNGVLKSNYKPFPKFNGAIKMIAISSIVALFISAALYLQPAGDIIERKNKDISKNNYEKESTDSNLTDTTMKEPGNLTNEKDSDNIEYPKYSIDIDILKQGQETNIPLLRLTDEELKDMNIFKTDFGYEIIGESIYNLEEEPRLSKILEKNKYPIEGIYKGKYTVKSESIQSEILPYQNWDLKKGAGIYPIMVQSFGKRKDGGSNSFTSTFGTSPLINPKYADEIVEEISRINTSYLNNKFLVVEDSFYEPLVLCVTKLNYKFINKMLMVLFQWESKDYKISTFVWFVPTKELLKILPERINGFAKYHIKPFEYVDSDYASGSNNFDNSKKTKINSINGIESLELTPEELKNISVKNISGKYYTNFQANIDPMRLLETMPDILPTIKKKFLDLGYDENFIKGIIRMEVIIDTNGISSKEVKYGGWDLNVPSPVLPVAVSVESHYCVYNSIKDAYNSFSNNFMAFSDSPLLTENYKELFTRNKDGNIIPQIDRLLPVRIIDGITDDSDSSKIKYREIKFWFVINKEFAELLPDRYRIPLLNELQIISDIETGKILESEACKYLKGEKSYFDICRISSENISDFNVYPNPSDGSTFTVKCNIKETGTLFIDLYDITGKLLLNLSKENISRPGEMTIPVNLKEKLTDGIYLLNLSDGKSNQLIRKLIVRN